MELDVERDIHVAKMTLPWRIVTRDAKNDSLVVEVGWKIQVVPR